MVFEQLTRTEYNKLDNQEKTDFRKKYITHYLPIFQEKVKGTGLSAEMLLAQAAKESGFGVSGLSVTDYNFGGQKYYGEISSENEGENYA